MNSIERVMTSRSPYLVGSAIGLLNTFAFATAQRGLGVTSAVEARWRSLESESLPTRST